MIAHLSGRILHASLDWLILSVGGVGYEVHVPVGTTGKLQPEPGADVHLWIHTSVREDAIQLFGFPSDEELRLFRELLSVNGVGPRLGLSVLSDLSPMEVVAAVHNDDVNTLTRVSGIGKKTAQRMILELKSRLTDFAWSPDLSSAPQGAVFDDLRSALSNLGFPAGKIDDVLPRLKAETAAQEDLDGLLREALKMLS